MAIFAVAVTAPSSRQAAELDCASDSGGVRGTASVPRVPRVWPRFGRARYRWLDFAARLRKRTPPRRVDRLALLVIRFRSNAYAPLWPYGIFTCDRGGSPGMAVKVPEHTLSPPHPPPHSTIVRTSPPPHSSSPPFPPSPSLDQGLCGPGPSRYPLPSLHLPDAPSLSRRHP